jgi:hypothetical protein
MANITDVNAVKFCNEQVRPSADRIMQFYWWCKGLQIQWTSQGLAAKIPNDATAQVIDGAATDGRTQITGADVITLLSNLQSLITSLEANSNLVLNQVAKLAVNPRP